MNRLLALIRREYWENKGSIRTTPLVMAGLYIVSTLMGVITMSYFDADGYTTRMAVEQLGEMSPEMRAEVVGSYRELFEAAGHDLPEDPYDRAQFDPHRPHIDAFAWPCQHCEGGTRRRVEEVIDAWYDSGSMPFAQHHYTGAALPEFDPDSGVGFPADFISEAVDQTRGWFYTLHVLGVLLFDRSAYENCIVLGHINDEKGFKMSKSKGNYLDPGEIFDTNGADAMPEYIGFLVEGLRIPVDADYFDDFYEMTRSMRMAGAESSVATECTGMYGFSPATLSALGYSDQVMSMTMALRDEKTQYSIEMDVSMEDMWDMDVDIALDGNMMAEFASGMAYQPRLRDMHMEVTDRSLNERVLRHCQQQGLSEVETLTAQLDSFRFIGRSNGIEFDQYIIDPYREFVLGKPTLVVTARPTNPIAFSQIDLYKASDVPALLNLAAVAR